MSNDDISGEQPEHMTSRAGGPKLRGHTDREEWWLHLFALWLFDENHRPNIMDYAKVLPFDEFLKRKREGRYTRNSE